MNKHLFTSSFLALFLLSVFSIIAEKSALERYDIAIQQAQDSCQKDLAEKLKQLREQFLNNLSQNSAQASAAAERLKQQANAAQAQIDELLKQHSAIFEQHLPQARAQARRANRLFEQSSPSQPAIQPAQIVRWTRNAFILIAIGSVITWTAMIVGAVYLYKKIKEPKKESPMPQADGKSHA